MTRIVAANTGDVPQVLRQRAEVQPGRTGDIGFDRRRTAGKDRLQFAGQVERVDRSRTGDAEQDLAKLTIAETVWSDRQTFKRNAHQIGCRIDQLTHVASPETAKRSLRHPVQLAPIGHRIQIAAGDHVDAGDLSAATGTALGQRTAGRISLHDAAAADQNRPGRSTRRRRHIVQNIRRIDRRGNPLGDRLRGVARFDPDRCAAGGHIAAAAAEIQRRGHSGRPGRNVDR